MKARGGLWSTALNVTCGVDAAPAGTDTVREGLGEAAQTIDRWQALKGLRNLRDRGFIFGDQASSAWREDYIRKSDPIAAFVLDCLLEINEQKFYITKADLYQKFVVYCNAKKLAADRSIRA